MSLRNVLMVMMVCAVTAACGNAKPIARTVNEAARIACETVFSEEELPQGMTPEEMCDKHEDLQPFIRQILAAKQTVGASHGLNTEGD